MRLKLHIYTYSTSIVSKFPTSVICSLAMLSLGTCPCLGLLHYCWMVEISTALTVTVSFITVLHYWHTDPENTRAGIIFGVHLAYPSCFTAEEWGPEMGFNLPYTLSGERTRARTQIILLLTFSMCFGLHSTFPSPFYMNCPRSFFCTLHKRFHASECFVFLLGIILTFRNLA